jgi:hypothetical protein
LSIYTSLYNLTCKDSNRKDRYEKQYTLENTEGAIKNRQSRETGNIGTQDESKTKQKLNTICVGNHYTQTNTNNVNKAKALLQTT